VSDSFPAPAFTDVAAAADVAEGELLAAMLPDGTSICLYRLDGEIGAVGGVCTHAEFAMADGTLRGDGTIECIWHGARFDCRTGAARRAPAVDPLPVYAVRVEKGRVLVGPEAGVTGARP
jgi:3-phenylpropionate/trans-cinnamate dioxygenase ferredoxin subunit